MLEGQLDMFGSAPKPAPPAPAAGGVHWLVVSTRTAKTACGIMICAYYHADRAALPFEDGDRIRCTTDRFDGTVSCARCREVMS